MKPLDQRPPDGAPGDVRLLSAPEANHPWQMGSAPVDRAPPPVRELPLAPPEPSPDFPRLPPSWYNPHS